MGSGLRPLLSVVPSSGDVLARFAQLPRGEYIPFLFLEFFAEGHLRSGYVAFDVLARLGVANEVLLIHAQAIKHSDWHRDWEYDMAVSLAQQALGDGFEAWYSRTRGVSRAEDDEEYQRNQQKKKEKWAAWDSALSKSCSCLPGFSGAGLVG
jgi:hypothetical protein